MLVRDQRAVKLTLVLLLTESVLCQEKWSFVEGELDKSKLGESASWSKKGTGGDRKGLSNDECCQERNNDKASTTSQKEFNTLKITRGDKFDGKYTQALDYLDNTVGSTKFYYVYPKESTLKAKISQDQLNFVPNSLINVMNNSIDSEVNVRTDENEIAQDFQDNMKKRKIETELEINLNSDIILDGKENINKNLSEKVRRGIKKPKVKIHTNFIKTSHSKKGIGITNSSTEANKKMSTTNTFINNTTEADKAVSFTFNINPTEANNKISTTLFNNSIDADNKMSTTLFNNSIDADNKMSITFINNSSDSNNKIRIAIINNSNDINQKTSTAFTNSSIESSNKMSITTNEYVQQSQQLENGIDKIPIKRDKNDKQGGNATDENITPKEDIGALWDDYVLGLNGSENLEDVDHRIIGGYLTPLDQVPYLVVILRRFRELCGGTLITLNHVLTAAHCVTIKGTKNIRYVILTPENYAIRYGSNFSETGGHIAPAGKFYVHPDYLSRKDLHIYMDLAIIWLPIRVDRSMVKIAELPLSGLNDESYDQMVRRGAECFVAGWGTTRKPMRKKRSFLVGTKLQLLDIKTCIRKFSDHGYGVSKTAHICTYSEGTDACQGDSGGGLYCNNKVWGVTSWGIGCAKKDIPGVFARVDTNLDFITSVIYLDGPGQMRSANSSSPNKRFYIISLYLSTFLVIALKKLL